MVWFQCEDCGENLKKPKLPNHFRSCSASKLSCIDCGVTFGQESVQSHTQCITETEKYGPKGPGKVQTSSNTKPNKDSKQQPDVDINVGLSERPPWFCSLCNTKATSKQALLLHADGKKHRSKARAFHAKKEPQKMEESAPECKAVAKDDLKGEMAELATMEQPGQPKISKVEKGAVNPEEENAKLTTDKKRKRDTPVGSGIAGDDNLAAGNGEVIQAKGEKAYEPKKISKKVKSDAVKEDQNESASTKEDAKKNIKWKKLITSALKSTADGTLKMRKLKKHVLQALKEAGFSVDEDELNCELEQKIVSSSRFRIVNKFVQLVDKHHN